ncbi:MAG: L-fuculokinase, partial [Phycisphaerae bacterium]
MSNPVIIVWDCGSTNVRAVAIDSAGKILSEAKAPNQTIPQPDGPPDWRIWDIEKIFNDLCNLTAKVVAHLDCSAVKGLTITTWGADAAPVDRQGNLVYPLISWQCSRTKTILERIKSKMDVRDIFRRTGYQLLSFNTLLKLIWIRENAPDAWAKTYKFLNHTGILNLRLTGKFTIDPTMAGTSMAFSISKRRWDNDLLALAGTDENIWPAMVEPGTVIGSILPDAAKKMNLPANIPVIAAGHDTQFALYGSGAAPEEAILSSGTWEILLARTTPFQPDQRTCDSGILIEQDACKGLVDPQFLMMASGTLEWVRNRFWTGEPETNIYAKMTAEAQTILPGANGVMFLANFISDSGPAAEYNTPSSIIGINVNTSRGEIYRAALEGLSMQLKHALEVFSQTINYKPQAIRVVGGGSKNPLWNQLRADITGLPVITITHQEATVLGAAMFALVAINEFADLDQARQAIDVGQTEILPSA